MIHVLFGEKGAGKTKRIIKMANDAIANAKGSIVFIDSDSQYMYEVKRAIRFVDASRYKIDGPKMFYGFLCGMAASDFDLECIFVDGFLKIVHHEPDTLADFFSQLKLFAEERSLDITLSISGDPKKAPDFLKEFIVQ